MNLNNITTRDDLRPALRTMRENREKLVSIHQNVLDAESTPAATVAELVKAIGYVAAAATVAELVNCVGSWDGRISRRSREWADNIDAATAGQLEKYGFYAPSEIHPAHIDQIAEAMQKYHPQVEPAAETEEPVEAEPEEMPSCDECAKKDNCTRATGIMFGGCRVEFVPAWVVLGFPLLSDAIRKYHDQWRKDAAFYVLNGYMSSWSEEDRKNPDRGLEQHSTPAKWDAYKAGKITREKAVEIATRRAAAKVNKREEKTFAALRTAAAAPALDVCRIELKRVKNSYWGNRPHATVTAENMVTYGAVSGSGFDTGSAAVASALNDNPAVLKVLYVAAEKALSEGKKPQIRTFSGCVSWHDILGYGSGYGVLPYFECGCGISAIGGVFNTCGFSFRQTASSPRFDSYTVSRKEEK